MTTFTTAKLDAQLQDANPNNPTYVPTDPIAPLETRLAVAAPEKTDACKTATVLWEDQFRLWKWHSRLMLVFVAATVVVLVVTLGIALIRSDIVAAISGAVGTVATGGGALFVKSERDKVLKLLNKRTTDRDKVCST